MRTSTNVMLAICFCHSQDWGYLKTSGEVAKDFREKMEVVEDKMKNKWETYSESRHRRRKSRRARKSGKPKDN